MRAHRERGRRMRGGRTDRSGAPGARARSMCSPASSVRPSRYSLSEWADRGSSKRFQELDERALVLIAERRFIERIGVAGLGVPRAEVMAAIDDIVWALTHFE